jgi:hypothetical protein
MRISLAIKHKFLIVFLSPYKRMVMGEVSMGKKILHGTMAAAVPLDIV